MLINALNSGASVFMADFEDAKSRTWENLLEGQRNLSEAIDRTIRLDTGEKVYELGEEVATLLVRPRGWHLPERHLEVDGRAMSGSLFDFGRGSATATARRASSSSRCRSAVTGSSSS